MGSIWLCLLYWRFSGSHSPQPYPVSTLRIVLVHYSSVFNGADSMSFQDIETGLARLPLSPSGAPQIPEESAFVTLQSSLSLQVFKINSNVQGILKLVDQLGTARDSAALRKSLCVLSLCRAGRDSCKTCGGIAMT